MGFKYTVKDESIFINGNRTIIATYVDNLLILVYIKEIIAKVKVSVSAAVQIVQWRASTALNSAVEALH